MERDDVTEEMRRERRRLLLLVAVLLATVGYGVWYLQTTIPRRIVVASGVKDASYHQDVQRYAAILARDGVTVEERMTGGAGENAALLLDPKANVDVAFMEGGVIPPDDGGDVVMLASLRYEPVWVFHRLDPGPTRLEDLRYRRIAIGAPGNGGRQIVEPMLAASNVTESNSRFLPLGGRAALVALQEGRADAAILVGGTRSPVIWQALHDERVGLMSMADADAYARRYPFLTPLSLPAGTIDMSYRRIPAQDTRLVATKAMLVAHDGLPPALVTLLFEAAREIHGGQGYFEAAREFPGTAPVDLPVSADADRHHRFGPGFLHRHLPFWVATYVEQLVVVVLPLLVVLVPIANFLPQILRWRVRSRIFRWYGELKLLERDVERRTGDLPIAAWLADLDRIARAAEHLRVPASYASESYTLREHVALVRRAVLAKADGSASPEPERSRVPAGQGRRL